MSILQKPPPDQLPPIGTVKVVEIPPDQIPDYWPSQHIRVIKYAVTFGLIKVGWVAKDYHVYAVDKGGYETAEIWAKQGSGKSSRLLQQGFWVYKDWDLVLKNVLLLMDAQHAPQYKDRAFIQRLKTIPRGRRVPWIGIDDLTVDYGNMAWRTDAKKYEAVDSAWAAIRTKISTVSVSNPIIDRLPKNLKDNITLEYFMGPNQVEQIERIVRLPGINKLESNFFKVMVEPLHRFNLYDVPRSVFKEYWNLRLELAEYAIQKMGKAWGNVEDLKGMIDVGSIVRECKVSPLSVASFCKEGLVKGEKINGKLYINQKDYESTIKPYYMKKRKNKPRPEKKA